MATIEAARRGGVVKASSVDRVIVDTTVMPKAIAYPTGSRLLEKSRQHLVKVAEERGTALRQNYNRIAPKLAAQIGRHAHTKQFKRMRKAVRTLRTAWVECSAKWRACLNSQRRRSVTQPTSANEEVVERLEPKNKLVVLGQCGGAVDAPGSQRGRRSSFVQAMQQF